MKFGVDLRWMGEIWGRFGMGEIWGRFGMVKFGVDLGWMVKFGVDLGWMGEIWGRWSNISPRLIPQRFRLLRPATRLFKFSNFYHASYHNVSDCCVREQYLFVCVI